MPLYNGKSNRYASATQRESARALQEMGFKEVGFKQGSHLVMMHDMLGRLEVPLHTPPKIVINNAKRKEKLLNSKTEQVIDWIHSVHQVGPTDQKSVEGVLSYWIQAAQKDLGGDVQKTNITTLIEAIRRNSRVQIIRKAHNSSKGTVPGMYRLTGRFYVAPDELAADGPATEEKAPAANKKGRPLSIDLELAQRLLNEGKDIWDVAKACNVSREAIYRHRKKGNLVMPTSGVKVVEGEADGFHADPLPVIETDGVPDLHPEPDAIDEMVKTINSEPVIHHEGLNVLGEYLKAINEMGEAQAKVELMKGGLDDLQHLYVERESLLRLLADLDMKIEQELNTLRSL